MKTLITKHIPLICFLVSGQCIADWPILDSPIGGFATAEMSKELPIMHSVHYSPNFDCKPVYSYLTQNFGKETGVVPLSVGFTIKSAIMGHTFR